MKLIKPSFEIIEQGAGLDGIYRQIELAGRTCYKSTDKITEDSAKGFVDRMVKSEHYAMLEHGTVYLKIPLTRNVSQLGCDVLLNRAKVYEYLYNPYSKVNASYDKDRYKHQCPLWAYITTNYRVLIENGWLDDLKYLCELTEHHEKRVTVKFVCDRGVSHEFVRHELCAA